MNIQETMAFIHDEKWRGSKPGLSRTQALLAALGNPEKKLRYIHIAGTNGKGSTAACMESILRHAGYKTGLYTSPYILEFGERMRVNGENIPPEALCRLAEQVRPAAKAMEDAPTEFELVTAMAFYYFAQEKCDLVVLEVGLGGEIDATNVIPVPEAAVITPIALDHTRELGPTLGDIAHAKGGIIKEGGMVVSAGGCPEADQVLAEICREKHAKLTQVDWDSLQVEKLTLQGNTFSYGGMVHLFLPLAGSYQPGNGALAVEAARQLAAKYPKITEAAIREGLAQVRWPGRFEVLREAHPAVILDGGHNPHGVQGTIRSLQAQFPSQKIWFLMGVMADKDVTGILQLLLPTAAGFITVTPDNLRAMAGEELAKIIEKLGGKARAAATIPEGVQLVFREAGENGVICALGTLYFSGDVRRAMAFLPRQDFTNSNKPSII